MTGERPTSPYKGLTAYDDTELDALLFFGREREREIVAANLTASRLTVLYGPSGVGKSSLLSAAVARSMRQLPDEPLVVVFSRWSDDPAAAIAEILAEANGANGETTALAALERAQQSRDVYLILDQAEEYFLYHGDDGGPDSFAELLPAVVGGRNRVNVLLSLREDSLAKLDRFTGRIPDLFGNTLRLDRLDREAARSAIVRPVERFAELTGERVAVEPALVDRVLDDVGAGRIEPALGGLGSVERRPDAARVEAPYLQLVMQRLWDEERAAGSNVLRVETLARLGGARHIVEEHLEGAMAELDEDGQEVAARLFNHLVTPSGTKIAHTVSDLADFGRVTEDQIRPVLETLAERRILRSLEEAGGARYEIFHDVLAQPVLAWRARRRTEREVAQKLVEAHRRRRRLQLLFGLVLVALALMTAVAIFAVSQRSEARAQAQKAETRTREARALRLEALALGKLGTDPQRGLVLARKAANVMHTSSSAATLRRALRASRLRRVIHVGEPVLRSVVRRRRVISATARGSVITTDLRTGHVRRKATGIPAVAATFADDGTALLTGSDGRMRLVQPAGSVVQVPESYFVRGAELSADARTAVAYNEFGGHLVEIPSGRLIMDFFRTETLAAAISHDGTLVATGHAAKTLRVWDVASGARIHKLFTHLGDIVAVAISPRDRLVASANSKGIAQVWRVNDERTVAILGGHTERLTDIGFSADGKRLVTASRDGTIRVGDVDKSAPSAVLLGAMKSVTSAAFAGGSRIVSANGDEVRLWDARPRSELNVRGGLDRLLALADRRLAAT